MTALLVMMTTLLLAPTQIGEAEVDAAMVQMEAPLEAEGPVVMRPDDAEAAALPDAAPSAADTAAPPVTDAREPFPLSANAATFSSGLGWIGPFERFPLIEPQRICAAIAAETASTTWEPGPFLKDIWECSSLDESQESNEIGDIGGEGTYEIFTIARGTRETYADSLRLKISAADAKSATKAAEVAMRRFEQLFSELNWVMPKRVISAIEHLYPFKETVYGTEVELSKERMADHSYNIVLKFPDSGRLLQGPSQNHFVADWAK